MQINFQELTGDALNWALLHVDEGYAPYTDPYSFYRMICHFKIDVKWILFEDRFNETATHGNWLAGMFSHTNGVPEWNTAFAQDPTEAVARVVVRSKLGREIDVPDWLF